MDPETVVITGASRGIGAAAARRLASPERHLVLLARSAGDLQRRVEDVHRRGGQASHLAVDFSDADDVQETLAELERRHPIVDGLVLNAGVANGLRFRDASRASIEREIDVNYLAPAELLLRVLPGMTKRGRGRIVVVGSLTSFVPFPGNASYCASKAALFSLVRSVRMEVRGSGVHIGMVLPGYTRTKMTENHKSYLPSMAPEQVAAAIEACLQGRRSLVVPGALNRVAARVFSVFPETSDRVLTHLARFVIPAQS